MDRHVGFIDFGYLKAASARLLQVDARRLKPIPRGCIKWLDELGPKLQDESVFLRAYWYDGAYDPRDPRHKPQRRYFDGIANTPGVQLRLGHLRERTPSWQYPVKAALRELDVDLSEFERHFEFRPELSQKGVDTRITLDLVRLAQRHVYDTAIVIAGDRDLAEPVRVAQDEGRRVIVARPRGAGIADELEQLADEVLILNKKTLSPMFEVAPEEGDS